MEKGQEMGKRLIYADDLMKYARNQKSRSVDCNDIARFPAVDAVEVVRCKECFYGSYHKYTEAIEVGKCMYCDIHSSFVGKSDFCSYGERRTNGND